MRFFRGGLISFVVALILSACSAEGDTTIATETTPVQTPAPSSTAVVVTDPVDDPGLLPGGINPAREVVVIGDPADGFPSGGIDIPATDFQTRVVEVGIDLDTPSELVLWAVVPTGWEFDEASASFTDGTGQHMEFFTSCDGECRLRAWSVSLGRDGGPLDEQVDRYGADRGNVGFGTRTDGGHLSRSGEFGRSTLFALSAWHDQAPLFLGCNVVAFTDNIDRQDGFDDLCKATVVDWDTVIANAPAPAAPVLVFTPEVSVLVDDLIAGRLADVGDRQIIDIDDEGERTVSISLPAGAESDIGIFGAEINLKQANSIFTDIGLDSGCDGSCEPKDWEAALSGFSAPLGKRRAALDIDDDGPIGDLGWIVAGRTSGGTDYGVHVFLWDDGAERYFECSAELDDSDTDLKSTVVSMCLSAQPDWFGEA